MVRMRSASGKPSNCVGHTAIAVTGFCLRESAYPNSMGSAAAYGRPSSASLGLGQLGTVERVKLELGS